MASALIFSPARTSGRTLRFIHSGPSAAIGGAADRVAVQAGVQPAAAMARHLLGLDDAEERIGRHAAILLGKTELQQAGGRGLAVELARELLGLVPLVDMGHDLALDEAADGAPEGLVLLGIEGAVPGRPRAERAWVNRRRPLGFSSVPCYTWWIIVSRVDSAKQPFILAGIEAATDRPCAGDGNWLLSFSLPSTGWRSAVSTAWSRSASCSSTRRPSWSTSPRATSSMLGAFVCLHGGRLVGPRLLARPSLIAVVAVGIFGALLDAHGAAPASSASRSSPSSC